MPDPERPYIVTKGVDLLKKVAETNGIKADPEEYLKRSNGNYSDAMDIMLDENGYEPYDSDTKKQIHDKEQLPILSSDYILKNRLSDAEQKDLETKSNEIFDKLQKGYGTETFGYEKVQNFKYDDKDKVRLKAELNTINERLRKDSDLRDLLPNVIKPEENVLGQKSYKKLKNEANKEIDSFTPASGLSYRDYSPTDQKILLEDQKREKAQKNLQEKIELDKEYLSDPVVVTANTAAVTAKALGNKEKEGLYASKKILNDQAAKLNRQYDMALEKFRAEPTDENGYRVDYIGAHIDAQAKEIAKGDKIANAVSIYARKKAKEVEAKAEVQGTVANIGTYLGNVGLSVRDRIANGLDDIISGKDDTLEEHQAKNLERGIAEADRMQQSRLRGGFRERYVEVDGQKLVVDNDGEVLYGVDDKFRPTDKDISKFIAKYEVNPDAYEQKADYSPTRLIGTSLQVMADMVPIIVANAAIGVASAALPGGQAKTLQALGSIGASAVTMFSDNLKRNLELGKGYNYAWNTAMGTTLVQALIEQAGGLEARAGRALGETAKTAMRTKLDDLVQSYAGRSLAKTDLVKKAKGVIKEYIGEGIEESGQDITSQVSDHMFYGVDVNIDWNDQFNTWASLPIGVGGVKAIVGHLQNRADRDMMRRGYNAAQSSTNGFNEVLDSQVADKSITEKEASIKREVLSESKADYDDINDNYDHISAKGKNRLVSLMADRDQNRMMADFIELGPGKETYAKKAEELDKKFRDLWKELDEKGRKDKERGHGDVRGINFDVETIKDEDNERQESGDVNGDTQGTGASEEVKAEGENKGTESQAGGTNNAYSGGTTEGTVPILTKEAEDILSDPAKVPVFISKNLERIAKENGIEITGSMTGADVINALKQKRDGKATNEPSGVQREATTEDGARQPGVSAVDPAGTKQAAVQETVPSGNKMSVLESTARKIISNQELTAEEKQERANNPKEVDRKVNSLRPIIEIQDRINKVDDDIEDLKFKSSHDPSTPYEDSEGNQGTIKIDDGGKAEFVYKGGVKELGNVSGGISENMRKAGIVAKGKVQPQGDNKYAIDGVFYKNNLSDPARAVEVDGEGNISVELDEVQGGYGNAKPVTKSRKFTGPQAEELAYQIHLEKISKDEKGFVEHVRQRGDGSVPAKAQEGAAKNNDGLREEGKDKQGDIFEPLQAQGEAAKTEEEIDAVIDEIDTIIDEALPEMSEEDKEWLEEQGVDPKELKKGKDAVEKDMANENAKVKGASVSGLTPEEQQKAIAKRDKETSFTPKEKAMQELWTIVDKYQAMAEGARGKSGTAGQKLWGDIMDKGRSIGVEVSRTKGVGKTHVVIRDKGKRVKNVKNFKEGNYKALTPNKDNGLLANRSQEVKDIFQKLWEDGTSHSIQVEYGVQLSDVQKEVAFDDVADGIPSNGAEAALDVIEGFVNNGNIVIFDKGAGEMHIPISQFFNPQLQADNSEVATAKKVLDSANKRLREAERRMAEANGVQASAFNAPQGSLFGVKGEDIKTVIDPLKKAVKEAREAYEKAVAKAEAEENAKNGQQSLFQKEKRKLEPIDTVLFNKLLKKLNKAIPGVFGAVLNGTAFEEKLKEMHGISMRDKKGIIYGFVGSDGKVYLNGDHINANTPIHEYGHLVINMMKTKFPQVYRRGLNLADKSPYLSTLLSQGKNSPYASLIERYKKGDKAPLQEEALAMAIGDMGERMVQRNMKNAFLEWVDKMWTSLKRVFGGKLTDMTPEQLNRLTFKQFATMVAGQLVSGDAVAESVLDKHFGDRKIKPKKIIKTSELREGDDFGNAAQISDDGSIIIYHVTDTDSLIKSLESNKDPKDTYNTDNTKIEELGSGIYGSAVPEYWANRSANKYSFLKDLSKENQKKLANKIKDTLNNYILKGYITQSEFEYATKLVRAYEKTGEDQLLMLSGQPYNIRFWENDYLKDLDIVNSDTPSVVAIKASGSFIEFADAPYLSKGDVDFLIKNGIDGAFVGGGLVNNPELVIFKKDSINGYRLDKLKGINFHSKQFKLVSGDAVSKGEMLAPNGKPSNLSPEQYRIVRTPEFKKWFGDSQVKDENGEPLVVYHGTTKYGGVTSFKKGKRGNIGPGIYFTNDKDYAQSYADKYGKGNGQNINVFVKIKNPFYVYGTEGAEALITKLYSKSIYENRARKQSNPNYLVTSADIAKLKSIGYDGIVWAVKEGGEYKEYSVFEPNQIKSAIGNTSFNPESNDIRFQVVGEKAAKTLDKAGSGVVDVEATAKALESLNETDHKAVEDINDKLYQPKYVEENKAREVIESFTHYKSGSNKYPATKWARWFQSVDANAKKDIVDDIKNNPELRNSMLSLLYDLYKNEIGFKGSFDEFILEPIKLYRGVTDADKKGKGQEGFSAYSISKNRVSGYAHNRSSENPEVKEVTVRPIDTYGAVNYIMGAEVEVLLPQNLSKETLQKEFNRLVELNIGKFSENQKSKLEQFYTNDDYIGGVQYAKSVINGTHKTIAEAYHKAKADGTNPELVKSVEQSLKETPKAEITDAEYSDFIDNGKVSNELLNSIAEKVKNRNELSDREKAIFANKTSEINEIIKQSEKPPKAKNKAFEELVNLIPTTDLRRPNGSIGTQGFSPENLVEVARHIAKEMGFDIPAYDKNKGTSEIKQVIDYLKNNKEAQQKIRDYVVKDPVVVSLLPDNTYEIEDGNHRANLLNLIGVDVIPTIELNGRDKQTAINEHNSKVEAVEQSLKETPQSPTNIVLAAKKLDNLVRAKELDSKGVDATTIFHSTGWQKGGDSKWRTEISDIFFNNLFDGDNPIAMQIEDNGLVKLGDLVSGEVLDAYPKLKDLPVKFVPGTPGNGQYDGNEIKLQYKNDMDFITNERVLLKALAHEIQHYIQDEEGFARGTTSDYFTEDKVNYMTQIVYEDFIFRGLEYDEYIKQHGNAAESLLEPIDEWKEFQKEAKKGKENVTKILADAKRHSVSKYRKVAGEVEANNVMTRMDMPLSERLVKTFTDTEDVAEDEKIYLFDSRVSNAVFDIKKAKAEKNRERAEDNVNMAKAKLFNAWNNLKTVGVVSDPWRNAENMKKVIDAAIELAIQVGARTKDEIRAALNDVIKKHNLSPNQLNNIARAVKAYYEPLDKDIFNDLAQNTDDAHEAFGFLRLMRRNTKDPIKYGKVLKLEDELTKRQIEYEESQQVPEGTENNTKSEILESFGEALNSYKMPLNQPKDVAITGAYNPLIDNEVFGTTMQASMLHAKGFVQNWFDLFKSRDISTKVFFQEVADYLAANPGSIYSEPIANASYRLLAELKRGYKNDKYWDSIYDIMNVPGQAQRRSNLGIALALGTKESSEHAFSGNLEAIEQFKASLNENLTDEELDENNHEEIKMLGAEIHEEESNRRPIPPPGYLQRKARRAYKEVEQNVINRVKEKIKGCK